MAYVHTNIHVHDDEDLVITREDHPSSGWTSITFTYGGYDTPLDITLHRDAVAKFDAAVRPPARNNNEEIVASLTALRANQYHSLYAVNILNRAIEALRS